tara:strand:- start:1599 stop:2717 length:1119 start_codon:yes stop_codon:yes gene_type:complete
MSESFTATAAVAHSGVEQFTLQAIEFAPLQGDEVIVEIHGVGICHTDVVVKAEVTEFPFPAILGHEGAGIVTRVGSGVNRVKAGDHVIVSFGSCGDCASCSADQPSYCHHMPELNYFGLRADGSPAITSEGKVIHSHFFGQSSFASHALSNERNLIVIDKDLPLELMGPIGCGIQTGAGAVMRSLNAQADQSILIAGGGAVGLSAVMAAAIRNCKQIIVMEPNAARRKLALELGATHVIDPTESPDLAEFIQQLSPAGVDLCVDTTGIPPVISALLAALAPRGTLGIVGITPPDTPPPGDLTMIMQRGLSIKGIMIGDTDLAEFIGELLQYYRAGSFPIDKLVTRYPLSAINEAMKDHMAGDCIKAVLLPRA